MGFFFNKRKENLFLIIHIGSSSVGASFVKKNKEGKNEILYTKRIKTNFLLDIDFDAFWRSVKDALVKTIAEAQKNFPSQPDAVFCIFSSPWFVSQTKIAQVKRDAPFEIKKDLFDQLVNNEIDIFLRHWQGHMEPLEGRATLIENKIMKTQLNGYPTEDPLGKKAKNISAYIYMSLGVKEVKETVEKEVSLSFNKVPVYFNTLPFAVYSVISQLSKSSDDYLFVEIGGETTDVSLVNKNILEETVSFSKGRNALSRRIASGFKTFVEEVPSLVERYDKGHGDEITNKKMAELIEGTSLDWAKSFSDAIKLISEKRPIPQNVFVVCEGSLLDKFLIKEMGNPEFAKFTIFEKPLSIIHISADSLKIHLVTAPKDLDQVLIIGSIFASNFLKRDE